MTIEKEVHFNKCKIYLKQTLEFFKPVFPGQIVKTTVTVDNINYKKKKLYLKLKRSVEDSLFLGVGATVLVPFITMDPIG